jgi:hypothetical protein
MGAMGVVTAATATGVVRVMGHVTGVRMVGVVSKLGYRGIARRKSQQIRSRIRGPDDCCLCSAERETGIVWMRLRSARKHGGKCYA